MSVVLGGKCCSRGSLPSSTGASSTPPVGGHAHHAGGRSPPSSSFFFTSLRPPAHRGVSPRGCVVWGADLQGDPPVVGDLLREALVLAVMLSKWFKKQIWGGFGAPPGMATCGADTRHCHPCENIQPRGEPSGTCSGAPKQAQLEAGSQQPERKAEEEDSLQVCFAFWVRPQLREITWR